MLTSLSDALGGEPELVLAVILGTAGMATAVLISLGVVIVREWRKVRQMECETSLKQEMLDRGMSAEEIATVISASRRSRQSFAWSWTDSSRAKWKTPVADHGLGR